MLCLDVQLNGEHYARAGLGDEGHMSAFVVWAKYGPPDDTVPVPPGSVLFTITGGTPEGTAVHWGDQIRHLTVGDAVTIRVVEADQPDPYVVTPMLPDLPEEE